MTKDEFTKLFKYIERRFDEVDIRFEEAKSERAEIRGAVSELAGLIRDYHQELQMLSRQVDRLKEAIQQIARETGVKLEVDL